MLQSKNLSLQLELLDLLRIFLENGHMNSDLGYNNILTEFEEIGICEEVEALSSSKNEQIASKAYELMNDYILQIQNFEDTDHYYFNN